jgi:hypothetical protein
MKNKTTLKIMVFATTLMVSVVLVTTIFNKNTFAYFGDGVSFRDRVKVYNFLMSDKATILKYSRKAEEQRLQPRPDAIEVLGKERVSMFLLSYDERLNADTSGLPEDFKEAWTKNTIARRSGFEAACSKAKRDDLEAIGEKAKAAEDDFRRVIAKYGFDLNPSGNFIAEES